MTSASAFFIDIDLIGEATARGRVLALWVAGTRLFEMSDGWLVVLGSPMDVRIEQGPGVPLRAIDGGLAGPGLTAGPGDVVMLRAGAVQRSRLSALVPVPLTTLIAVDSFQVHQLAPCEAPPPEVAVPEDVSSPLRVSNLRALSGVANRKGPPPRRWPWLVGLLVIVGVVSVVLLTRHGRSGAISNKPAGPRGSVTVSSPVPDSSSTPEPPARSAAPDPSIDPLVVIPPVDAERPSTEASARAQLFDLLGLLIVAIVAVGMRLRAGRRRAARRGGSPERAGKTSGWRGWWASVVLRSPARGVVSRRHERYLRRLDRHFTSGNWDSALREAIALGGTSVPAGMMTLRIPERRRSLRLGVGNDPVSSVSYGPIVYQYLNDLYRRAVASLESAGRIEEAAFVYDELLHDSAAAVALLERHDRKRLSAELAEGRGLAADLVVRQWWIAGDQVQAVEIARTRGAFPGAILRLAETEPAAAVQLRREWVSACGAAGDFLGAVEAAWPETSLRRSVLPNIRSGIELAGPVAARLTAYLVALEPGAAEFARSAGLLEGTDLANRRAFISALAEVPGDAPALDRRLCSLALRALLRDNRTLEGHGVGAARKIIRTLKRRADPVLVADLPPVTVTARRSGAPIEFELASEDGQLAVHDAIPLADGCILLALGDLGVRLVRPDGRTAGHWDTPARSLIAADHGATALLVNPLGGALQMSRLDLAGRRVSYWSTLDLRYVLPSYDGGVLTVVDDDGIALLDVLADRPRILRRELDRNAEVLRIGRTPGSLMALVSVPQTTSVGGRVTELWRWSLPDMLLRVRRRLVHGNEVRAMAVVGEELVVLADAGPNRTQLRRYGGYEKPVLVNLAPGREVRLIADGDSYGLLYPGEQGGALGQIMAGRHRVAQVRFPADRRIQLRASGGRLALWTESGSIATVDVHAAQLVANLRTVL